MYSIQLSNAAVRLMGSRNLQTHQSSKIGRSIIDRISIVTCLTTTKGVTILPINIACNSCVKNGCLPSSLVRIDSRAILLQNNGLLPIVAATVAWSSA